VTSAGVQQVARHNPFSRDARRAVVVVSDEAFGLARMFGLFADVEHEQMRIFRDMKAAFEWVGLDLDGPWPAQPPDATFGEA
jgi:hypothetical protein